MENNFDKNNGDEFTCYGCSKKVVVENSEPTLRAFAWEDRKGKKHDYCFDCDDLLLQDQELPNRKS